jgi:DNA-binding LacI/PurR family transcriptional regulator
LDTLRLPRNLRRITGQRSRPQARLDAIFVAPDLMAAGALRALRRSGRRVPEDVAVIGFDDSPLARTPTRN